MVHILLMFAGDLNEFYLLFATLFYMLTVHIRELSNWVCVLIMKACCVL